MNNNDALKKKTVYGFFWSFTDLMSKYGIQFVVQIFLARLLSPRDFGLIGMMTVIIVISQTIVDSGFGSALIREKYSSQEDYSTVFHFNLIISVLLYLILYYIANDISVFFKEPKLIQILRILSLVIIVNAFGLIQRIVLIKKMDFKTQTKISIISSFISGVLAIVLAKLGFGVWSLVYQNLFMQLLQSSLLIWSNRWFPSMVFSMTSFKKMFGFGWKLLISGLVNTIYQNIYYVIIGRSFSAIELGYYTNSQKLRDLAAQSMTVSIQKVSYPVLSSIKDDESRLKLGYRKLIKNSVFITFPIMIGLSTIATQLINVLFGISWTKSIPYFQVLCFAGMLFPLQAINLNILKVKGRSDLFLKVEIIKKVVGIILIAIVLLNKLGVVGLLVVAVINSYISYFINSFYSSYLLNYSTLEQLIDILPVWIISIFMGIIVWLSKFVLPDIEFVKLALQIIIGIFAYLTMCRLCKIKELDTVIGVFKSIFKY